ncbi:hemogen isoform X2 [Emydura macquarii macquarii]|uniref:hemogen isoform X2 n=1 Tax=Emydura macquarii macquarii TaxID=1129001 RepID=UPI003529FC70
MEGFEKEHSYSESSQQPPPAGEEYSVPGVIITRRLRDRELLRKRKAEAQEKDTVQERRKSTRPKRGRVAGRGRGRRQLREPEPALEVPEEMEKEPAEKAPASPEHHEQPPVPAAQELSGGTQQEVAEGPPGEDVLHPAELGEAPRSEEAGISEALNVPLENDHTDNGYVPSVLF